MSKQSDILNYARHCGDSILQDVSIVEQNNTAIKELIETLEKLPTDKTTVKVFRTDMHNIAFKVDSAIIEKAIKLNIEEFQAENKRIIKKITTVKANSLGA